MERNGIDESFSRKNKNFDRNGCCRGFGISAGYAEINFSVLVFITMIAAASPIAVIGCFHGLRWSLAASAATMLVVTMTGGPEIGLTTAVYAAALGTTLGEGYRRKWTYSKKIWTTALAYVAEMSYKIIFPFTSSALQMLCQPDWTG